MPIWRDLLDLYLAPASAGLLPWPRAFRWLRWLASRELLYTQDVAAAKRERETVLRSETPAQWRDSFRLVKLVDHADLYLSLTRSDSWMKRYLRVSGAWPKQGPFIAFTFHWGTGFWSLRHLRATGLRPAMLSTPLGPAPPLGDWRGRYGFWRNREVARATGEAIIYLGGAKDKIRRHLASGGVVVGLMDVPSCQTPESIAVEILGRPSALPRGLLDLASELSVPLVPFLLSLDIATGQRHLRICSPLAGASTEDLARDAAALMSETLGADPPAWHRWADASLFFSAAKQQRG